MEHSLETLKSCPSCGHDSFNDNLVCLDHTYSKEHFRLVECEHCKLIFTNPRPNEQAIGKYYDNPEYVSHTDTRSGLLFTLYGLVKARALKQKRRYLEQLTSGRTVLDYGAGSGDFCAELATNNWSVSAYEPDAGARKRISEKNKQIEVLDNLSQLESNSRSVITLWHVLEHVHALEQTVKEFHRILAPTGTLIIAVPNHTSFDARFYSSEWAAYDVPRHLYHFNPETLGTFMKSNGYELKAIEPMWFDSYYVGLLSEKNQGNTGILKSPFAWIRAFLIGSYSNVLAYFNKKKCSSVTYVFKKAI